MQLIRQRAYARAGLVGNPSDGYHGRTISISLRNFWAEVVLYEWEDVELISSQEDQSCFRSVGDLVRDVRLHGYYGGIRLVKATVKQFVDYCVRQHIGLHQRNFSIRYESNIPRQVGMAGSSAIVVATLRCLMEFYEVASLIPPDVQPSLALAVETEELGLPAGLQDRVIQVHEGAVFMDFSREAMRTKHGYQCGVYERLPLPLPAPLYVAYKLDAGKPVQAVHSDLRIRFLQGDPAVVSAMQKLAALTTEARAAILTHDAGKLAALMDETFDIRRQITQVQEDHLEMVRRARAVGASANFTGSGGAIIGAYRDASMFEELEKSLAANGCRVFRPVVA